ncbi:MAG: hypothetical protein ACSW8B_01720 [bacterium]
MLFLELDVFFEATDDFLVLFLEVSFFDWADFFDAVLFLELVFFEDFFLVDFVDFTFFFAETTSVNSPSFFWFVRCNALILPMLLNSMTAVINKQDSLKTVN